LDWAKCLVFNYIQAWSGAANYWLPLKFSLSDTILRYYVRRWGYILRQGTQVFASLVQSLTQEHSSWRHPQPSRILMCRLPSREKVVDISCVETVVNHWSDSVIVDSWGSWKVWCGSRRFQVAEEELTSAQSVDAALARFEAGGRQLRCPPQL
jgi:hypothetical protein